MADKHHPSLRHAQLCLPIHPHIHQPGLPNVIWPNLTGSVLWSRSAVSGCGEPTAFDVLHQLPGLQQPERQLGKFLEVMRGSAIEGRRRRGLWSLGSTDACANVPTDLRWRKSQRCQPQLVLSARSGLSSCRPTVSCPVGFTNAEERAERTMQISTCF